MLSMRELRCHHIEIIRCLRRARRRDATLGYCCQRHTMPCAVRQAGALPLC